jgi:hypothetical protein
MIVLLKLDLHGALHGLASASSEPVPDGLDTKDQHVFDAETASGRVVGHGDRQTDYLSSISITIPHCMQHPYRFSSSRM